MEEILYVFYDNDNYVYGCCTEENLNDMVETMVYHPEKITEIEIDLRDIKAMIIKPTDINKYINCGETLDRPQIMEFRRYEKYDDYVDENGEECSEPFNYLGLAFEGLGGIDIELNVKDKESWEYWSGKRRR